MRYVRIPFPFAIAVTERVNTVLRSILSKGRKLPSFILMKLRMKPDVHPMTTRENVDKRQRGAVTPPNLKRLSAADHHLIG